MKGIINSEQSLERAIEALREQFNQHKYLRLDVKTGRQRTNPQNAALHLYCEMIADALNDAGLDFEEVFKSGYKVPWSKEIIKEHLWRPVQKSITGHSSSTKPNTDDYPKIYDYINHRLSEYGINVEWPNQEQTNDISSSS